MDPDQSGTEQTSPRGNDWEVVQLTASAYAAAPPPRRPEPSEEAEAKKYGAKGDDSADALLMSGHFSLSQNEVESLLTGTYSKERQKELCSQDDVSNEGDDEKYQETCKHKLEDDIPRIPSFEKGKHVSLVDMEFDDGKALQGMSLVGEEPIGFSSPIYSPVEEKDISWSATESRNDKKTEESTLHNVNPVNSSSKVVASGEENKPDGSGPRGAWWKKQLLSLYKNAKESNNFWPFVAAAAALVGLAYFGHRWHKGKMQLQPVKPQPSSNKERIHDAVRPLNRIKDILVAGNHPSAGIHGHVRAS